MSHQLHWVTDLMTHPSCLINPSCLIQQKYLFCFKFELHRSSHIGSCFTSDKHKHVGSSHNRHMPHMTALFITSQTRTALFMLQTHTTRTKRAVIKAMAFQFKHTFLNRPSIKKLLQINFILYLLKWSKMLLRLGSPLKNTCNFAHLYPKIPSALPEDMPHGHSVLATYNFK